MRRPGFLVLVLGMVSACGGDPRFADGGTSDAGMNERDAQLRDGAPPSDAGPTPCDTDAQCPGAVCDPLAHRCVECLFDSQCGTDARCRDNACEPITRCANSLDCTGAAPRTICDLTTGTCEECVVTADCSGDNSECLDRRCVEYTPCINSLDCGGALPICDMTRGRCVECTASADCEDGEGCVENECIVVRPCDSDNECTPFGMLCDRVGGLCVQCLQHADCPSVYHCERGSCEIDACAAGELSCQANAVQSCTAAGDGYTSTPCGTQQTCSDSGGAHCEPWVCNAGQTYCENDDLIVCAEDGLSIVSATDCTASGLSCFVDECRSQLCTPNAQYCDGNTVMQCSSTGLTASVVDPCSGTEYCDDASATCEPQICMPSAPACDRTRATTCNAEGSGYLAGGIDCAASGRVCVSGACQDCAAGGAFRSLRIVEVSYDPDYVILENTSNTCPAELGGRVIWFRANTTTATDTWQFTLPSLSVPPGGHVFVADNGEAQPGDIEATDNIYLLATTGASITLCDGACSSGNGTNVIDAVQASGTDATLGPASPLPTGIAFSPGPLSAGSIGTNQAFVRTAFSGTNPAFLRSDWSVGSATRPPGTMSSCPSTAPIDGSFCAELGQTCIYGISTCLCFLTWTCT